MSVDLTVLGKSIERLQQEVREVHAEQTSLRAELAGLRAHFTAHLTGLHASLEAAVEARLEALNAALDVRFATTHRQMATDLEIVLRELAKLSKSADERFEAADRQTELLLSEIRSLKR